MHSTACLFLQLPHISTHYSPDHSWKGVTRSRSKNSFVLFGLPWQCLTPQLSLAAFVSFVLISRGMEDQAAKKLKDAVKSKTVSIKEKATSAAEAVESKVKGMPASSEHKCFSFAYPPPCMHRSHPLDSVFFSSTGANTPKKEIAGLVGK